MQIRTPAAAFTFTLKCVYCGEYATPERGPVFERSFVGEEGLVLAHSYCPPDETSDFLLEQDLFIHGLWSTGQLEAAEIAVIENS